MRVYTQKVRVYTHVGARICACMERGLARVLDPVALDAAAEGVAGDAELSGGLDPVAARAAEGFLDEGFFNVRDIQIEGFQNLVQIRRRV